MNSLFIKSTTEEIALRINKLSPCSSAKWGKMNVSQMLSHCQGPLEVSMGIKKIKKPNFALSFLMKSFKKSMYNDTLWKQNLPTPKEFKVTVEKEFLLEKDNLLTLTKRFYDDKEHAPWLSHPVFGDFTKEQWGQLNYKHLDHHLRQFGV